MIKISFGGDLCLANDPTFKKIGIVNSLNSDYKQNIIKELSNLFHTSDISIINFESPMTFDTQIARANSFLIPPETIEILKKSNILFANIANNHILQHGEKLFDDTIELLRNAGISIIGKYEKEISDTVITLELKDKKIGIAGFNERHDFINNNKYSELTKLNVLKTLEYMNNQKYDIKILIFHWGNEYVNIPSQSQIDMAHNFIDYGANIIVGHHSHVIQPVEIYNGGIIAYSLGNLLFDNLYSRDFKISAVLNICINEINELQYKLIPIYLDEHKIFDETKCKIVERKLVELNSQFDSLKTLDSTKYIRTFNKVLKRKRYYQRILMKVYLVKRILLSNIEVKKQIFMNLKEILNRKLKNEND